MDQWRYIIFVIGFVIICGVLFQFKFNDEEEDVALFNSYITQFKKNYSQLTEEYEKRLSHFKEARDLVEEWNKHRITPWSAVYGLTQFADNSRDEFSKKYLKRHSHGNHSRHQHHNRSHHTRTHDIVKRAIDANLPMKIDWRIKSAVNPVQNQGLCGACWAFCMIGTIESMTFIQKGFLPRLSIQEMIDCAANGNMGCGGGDPCALAEWLYDNNIKIPSEYEYPLQRKDGVCKAKNYTDGVQLAGYNCEYLVPREEKILKYLANHGPVAVAVNALTWQYYIGGVIDSNCPGNIEQLNHAVQIIGYDLEFTVPHYIVQNSWGEKFGREGFVKVAIGKNMCGIASEVTSVDIM